MLVHRIDSWSEGKWGIALIFGVGLIGSSVVRAVTRNGVLDSKEFPYTWNPTIEYGPEKVTIVRQVGHWLEYLAKAGSGEGEVQVTVIWSAGKNGFDVTSVQAEQELAAFFGVLDLAKRLKHEFPASPHSFFMVSSAGGLFEGQVNVDCDAVPCPMRPYGVLKQKQEVALLETDPAIHKAIFRPSSVYGFAGKSKRMGLVPTLILNGLGYRVSNIFGRIDTLRDFVFARDIGAFIAKKLTSWRDTLCQVFLLASGKPSSVHEVIQMVKRILNRGIYVRFQSGDRNGADNSYSENVLPEFWALTDLETGIRQTYFDLIAGLEK